MASSSQRPSLNELSIWRPEPLGTAEDASAATKSGEHVSGRVKNDVALLITGDNQDTRFDLSKSDVDPLSTDRNKVLSPSICSASG